MKAVQYRRFRDEVISHYEAMGAARRSQIDRIEASLREGVSVILTGPAGIGKSYIAAGLASRVAAGVRDAGGDDAVYRCGRSTDAARLRGLRAGATAERGLVTVEDAHLLDADDLKGLADVVAASNRPFLITMDVAPADPYAPEWLERSQVVTSLWANLGLERVDLSGIGFTEASALIDRVCGDNGVDVVTRARIVHGAGGNPLLVIELTREALGRSGGIGVDSSSLILGPITLSARILDLTRSRLAGLSDADEYALVTLAKFGPVPYVRATRLVGQAPLRSLLRRGLVQHEPGSPEYVTANVLFANAAQAGRDVANPLDAEHTVERLLIAEYRDGARLRAVECVIVAAYWVNNPDVDPLDGLPALAASDVLTRAASRADLWGLPASAEIFARRSLALSPSVAAVEQLSRALAGQGLHTAAVDILEGESLDHQDQYDDASMLSWWYMLLAWHGFDPDRAAELHEHVRRWGTVDDVLAEGDRLLDLCEALLESEYVEGIEPLVAFASDTSNSHAGRLRALSALIPAFTFLGRPEKLQAAFDLGRDIVGELSATNSRRSLGEPRVAAAIFLHTAGLAKAVVGDDRAGLMRDLDVYALRAVLTGNALELSLVNLVSGALSLTSQRPARAEIELASAEVGISRKLEPSATVSARLLRANALATLDRADEAEELLASFTGDELRSSPWNEFYARFLDIALIVDLQNLLPARRALLELAAFKDGRSRHITLAALYGAKLAGATASELVDRLQELETTGSSEFADAIEEQLRAEIANDGFRLDAVAARFERLGFNEQSAHAYQCAGEAHLAHGSPADAAASYQRRDAQARNAGAVATAAERQSSVSRENVARLTRRELEVAQLAGLGLSNSEIASRLFLSVRTVESHVLQARVKLGAASRNDLGLYLAHVDRQVS